jgi:hypothetical protein
VTAVTISPAVPGYNGVIRAGIAGKDKGETTMTKRTNKAANIEGKFFGMIVLAWAVLAVLFNVAHSALPQAKAKSPVAATAVAAPRADQVASLR